MAKLHPHLKHFIRSVIASELMESVGPSKKYEFKEGVMRALQESILEDIDSVQTQEDLEKLVDQKVAKFRAEQLEPLLKMIERVVKQIPLSVFKHLKT